MKKFVEVLNTVFEWNVVQLKFFELSWALFFFLFLYLLFIRAHFLFKERFIDSEQDQAHFESSEKTSKFGQSHDYIVWVSTKGVTDSWKLEVDLNCVLNHYIFFDSLVVTIEKESYHLFIRFC